MWCSSWPGPGNGSPLWVSELVAAWPVKRIAEPFWPGCSAEVRPGAPPVLPDGVVAAGGELAVCGGRDWLPLRTDHVADPLREVFGPRPVRVRGGSGHGVGGWRPGWLARALREGHAQAGYESDGERQCHLDIKHERLLFRPQE